MARSLPLSAYLALRGADPGDRTPAPVYPGPRPTGALVWVHCAAAGQLAAVATLGHRLTAEGDRITLLATLPAGFDAPAPDGVTLVAAPVGRRQLQAFLDHWAPTVVVWMQDQLDPRIIATLDQRGIPALLVDAGRGVLTPADGRWVPGLTRALLSRFAAITTADTQTARSIVQAGAEDDRVHAIGALEATVAVLPYHEKERADLARTLGTRPVWLAAGVAGSEIDLLATAHLQASRRAHRLLLIAALNDPGDASAAEQTFRAHGLDVVLRRDDAEPGEASQVYLVDVSEIGLWYRLSPIAYLAGSLTGTSRCRDPFEAATLGSAVVHGRMIAPNHRQIDRLTGAKGCHAVRRPADLGTAIEGLLAPDRVASLAHAAWDVATRGAEVTDRVARMLLDLIDAKGGG